jgi:hypothetical protein
MQMARSGRVWALVETEAEKSGLYRSEDCGDSWALVSWQADADTRKTDALDEGREPAGEQIGADQEGHVFGRHLQRAAKDQRHRDRPRIHHQHMLEPEGQQPRSRQ